MKLMRKIEINIPINCKILIWNKIKNKKDNNISIIHNSKEFKFILKKNRFKIDKWSNSLVTLAEKKITFFEEFFKMWNLFYLTKIKFKGKGFKIRILRKNKIIKFYFGKSHITQIFLKKIKKKRINKYKFILLSLNKEKLNNVCKTIKKIKKVNFYTLRGIRSSRQIIYKRKGKKGTYI